MDNLDEGKKRGFPSMDYDARPYMAPNLQPSQLHARLAISSTPLQAIEVEIQSEDGDTSENGNQGDNEP